MLEFRRDAARVLRWLRTGKEIVRLTYRGEAVADLVPVRKKPIQRPPSDDPFYRIAELAGKGKGLSNEEIDRLVYEQV